MVLRKGGVVEQGSHLELLRKKGLYLTLWKQQGLEQDETEGAQGGIVRATS